jgi:hypothetical protein
MPQTEPTIALAIDPSDEVAAAAEVGWAVEQLEAALAIHGIRARRVPSAAAAEAGGIVLIAGSRSAAAAAPLAAADRTTLEAPEALAIVATTEGGRPATLAAGADARGLVYAVLELADRVACAPDASSAIAALDQPESIVERPANRIRSALRTLASDVEDLGWFRDRDFWDRYLTELATQRFNRFELATGIGYDFAVRMRDSYLYLAYPFLIDVPGYEVRAAGVTAEERDANLAALRYAAMATKQRGLHFQLGLWAQVYEYEDSPDVNHPIEGLTRENHAPYCRDAVRALLRAVPEIDGVTLRVHGESGIPEGSYGFWETMLQGVADCGRTVEIDMHAKGIDDRMIELGLATGQPLVISPKFWAEHLGLPYHQADIRAVERPGKPTGEHAVLMAMSIGERRFTRYGYADLLREDRQYGVLFRIWPGTQRILLWGDPTFGRAYGQTFSFCGADGVEIFEPLSMAGRRGSGGLEGRQTYADPTLHPDGPNGSWEKYRYTYRLWGRLLYNPNADPTVWRRYLRRELGGAAAAAEAALASASRILPLVTTAHHPSAANNRYWPEVYASLPIVDGLPHHYADTAEPKRFGNVSALDPEVFSTAEEHVEEVLSGRSSGRYSPADVARWLDALASDAERHVAEAERLGEAESPALRRLVLDVQIQAALGRFWAGKLRAAVGYALHARTGDPDALTGAVAEYRRARDAYARAAELGAAYKSDLTFGPEPFLRGHWRDRLGAIDQDIEAMAAQIGRPTGVQAKGPSLEAILTRQRPEIELIHQPPTSFEPGARLDLEARVPDGIALRAARLHYRRVTQGERWRSVDLAPGGSPRGEIPGEYTDSPFPLQYFFELHRADGQVWRWPGIGRDLGGTPYRVVRARGAT